MQKGDSPRYPSGEGYAFCFGLWTILDRHAQDRTIWIRSRIPGIILGKELVLKRSVLRAQLGCCFGSDCIVESIHTTGGTVVGGDVVPAAHIASITYIAVTQPDRVDSIAVIGDADRDRNRITGAIVGIR